MLALPALYGASKLSGLPRGNGGLIDDLFLLPVAAAAVACAAAAARRCRTEPRVRSAWSLIALGLACWLAGDAARAGYVIAGHKPYPSLADAPRLAFYPLVLLGLLRFPSVARTRAELVRLCLDLAVVAIGGASLLILVLGPSIVRGGHTPIQVGVSIAYALGDTIGVAAVGSVLLRGSVPSRRAPLRLIATGLAFFITASVLFGYLMLHGTRAHPDLPTALWMLALALFAVAGSAQRAPDGDAEAPAAREQASWAPYVAVAVGFGLPLWNERNDKLLPNGALLLAAVILTVLVLVRQYLAQHDLLRTRGELSFNALHDALTHLPNRALVIDRAEQMLARARRNDVPVAALSVDVDGFARVNDSLGHGAGDELLTAIGARLQDAVREGDTVGRMRGDGFAVLLENLAFDAGPELVAERICEVLAEPVALAHAGGRSVSVTASVGIAVGQQCTAGELLRDADAALSEAKRAGSNRWVTFESRMQTAARERLELEMDLEQALARDELFLVFQPWFELESERITGVEALVRWRHPTRGVIPPGAFIPLLEQTGLIVRAGELVLSSACSEGARWRRLGHPLDVSVNVSARQLEDRSFLDAVRRALDTSGLPPACLTLEITETALMQDLELTAARLAALKRLGIRVAIDDFGTGYSSLAYLQRFPVDILKIDRSFVSGLTASLQTRALVHTLVQLARSLQLEVIAEGIEEDAQLRQLLAEGCATGQGFLLQPPLEPREIDRLVEEARRTQAGHRAPDGALRSSSA